jgi:glycine cleavage system H protein
VRREKSMAAEQDLQYTAEHEWILVEGDVATVGVTAYAAEKLGDVVFVELPQVGSDVTAGRVVGEIESTKSVGELFAPVDGTVAAINDAVVDAPELVNSDPFGAGWLVKVSFTQLPDDLLSFDEYAALTGE